MRLLRFEGKHRTLLPPSFTRGDGRRLGGSRRYSGASIAAFRRIRTAADSPRPSGTPLINAGGKVFPMPLASTGDRKGRPYAGVPIPSQKTKKRNGPGAVPCVLVFFVREKSNDSVGLTFQDGAELFHGKHGDGFVMLQIVDGPGIEAVLVDERIGGDPFLFHGLP